MTDLEANNRANKFFIAEKYLLGYYFLFTLLQQAAQKFVFLYSFKNF